jgi:quercetin dioxygenase-like cupin family protein
MVVQIEQGRTNPSIGTLSKLSDALGISLPDLVGGGEVPQVRVVPGDEAAMLWETPAGSSARLLVGGRQPDFIEIWEWVLAPGESYVGRAHPIGIRELLHVDSGELTLVVGDESLIVKKGASAAYSADQPHEYRNEGTDRVRLILVMVDPSGSRAMP